MLEVELVGAHKVKAQHEQEGCYAVGRYAKASIDECLGDMCSTASCSILYFIWCDVG